MENEQNLSQLTAIVGADNVQSPPASLLPEAWTASPLAIVTPDSTDQVAPLVQAAEAAGLAILPCGGGTQLQTGYPPRADRPFFLLSTARLNRILDYQPEDLTITCEPGVTLATVQQHLVPNGLMLALDAPLPERATLGGLVSTNTAGFWRPAYGSPRDLLIGLHAVMTGGITVKGGGKVVKNVAGYDLCKLFTGAWGTLGVLTDLTFKLRTRPLSERVLAWDAPDLPTAARVGLALHHARLAAAYTIATNEPGGNSGLILGLQGTPERVEWQAEEFSRLAANAGLSGRPYALTDDDLAYEQNLQARLDPEIHLATRIACLPTELPDLLSRLHALPDLRLTAHCATGILSLAASDADPELVKKIDALLPKNAHRVWTRLDKALLADERLSLWGEGRAEFHLHRALKQSLDPQNTFSPGRFLGRL